MRKRFEPQTVLGIKNIEDTPIFSKSRDDIPALVSALLKIYTTQKYRTSILDVLQAHITKGKKATGRQGLTLWQIFVLAQFRLALNIDYDRLHYMTQSNSVLRQLLGIETETGFERIEIGYQRILDNLHLLDDVTLMKINDIIVDFGHKEVFKKNPTTALSLKTDSFVVETNVHFPTDYNLLWDSTRKALDIITWFKKQQNYTKEWRKSKDWYRSLKNLCRALGVASSSGGKHKAERLTKATKAYLTKTKTFTKKLKASKDQLPLDKPMAYVKLLELDQFIALIDKHIDLVERRLLKGETIPHQEKLFSIFEQHTEWITKGKLRPNVELGKRTCITTDQYGLITDNYLMDHQADSQVLVEVTNTVSSKYRINSWSFDKGFWSKDNKIHLETIAVKAILPKKGKPNKDEAIEEATPEFKKKRRKHSAVESNINELEHSGLDKCPDKGLQGFKRYVAMAVVAYNLKRIGREIKRQEDLNRKKRLTGKAA